MTDAGARGKLYCGRAYIREGEHMSDHHLAMAADGGMDDLPRTLRRERDAREREARERDYQMSSQATMMTAERDAPVPPPFADDLQMSAVRRLDVPFMHLMLFFMKAVFAAIPALIILGVLLWLAGAGLQAFFPQLVKMKILISFPN